jgi:hypothetical protein
MQENKDPYSDYDLDDWQWEFLRRNPRYIKAYKGVEWLKKRLDKNTPRVQNGSFKAFGVSCHFSKDYLTAQRFVWKYEEKWTDHDGSFTSGWYLDLPSPSASSDEYKAKILRMRKPRAVVQLGEWSDEDETHWDMRPPFEEHKIAVLIDARYDTDRIISELKQVLKNHRPTNRNHFERYPEYLKVWELRRDRKGRNKIACLLWPQEYKNSKNAAIQKVRYYEDKFQELIDDSFPPKRRSPKIKK